ncbi:MAG: hypothetical protein GX574_10535 [Lentisphaerae bacterium]|nr:hypothetical protein [Lentisphaerota bacterium]HQL86592.1 hypothetical protein [Lentisphaeria bacterium]
MEKKMQVEIYVEPSPLMQALRAAGSVGSQMVSEGLLANLIRGADRDLGLGGRLIQHMSGNRIAIQTVNEMSDDQWRQFLNKRFGHSEWSRWFAKNSGNRYSIVVVE